jgi:demethylmenaquinone methyltransferase/2-methoxy-6-polyprenyl-1,4-benzoquinol methylase
LSTITITYNPPRMTAQPLPPHPPLQQYYGDASQRQRFVRALFDDTAVWYDEIIGMLSFGSGGRYRRDALRRAGLNGTTRLLDLACGTQPVARAAASVARRVSCADPSIGMLLAGRGRTRLPLVQTPGEKLPFRDRSFDLISVGFAMRHFSDLHVVFNECRRVLAPGGRLLIMEITPPRSRMGRAMLRFHLDRVVPFFARVRSGSREAATLIHYFWDTIESCVPPETIMQALRESQFTNVGRHVELGIFSEYSASRSA